MQIYHLAGLFSSQKDPPWYKNTIKKIISL